MRAKMILFLLAVPMLPACTSADYARSTANVNDDLYYMPAPATPATTVVQAPPVSGAAAPAEAAPAVRYEDGMSDYERYLLEKESAQTTVPSGAVSGTAARQSTASETRGELFYADDGSVYYSGPSATVEETPSAAKSGKTTVVNNYYYYDDPWYDPWYYDPWYDPWYYDPWYDGYLFRDPYYYRSWASPRFSIGYSTGWGLYPRSRWSIHLGWGWDPLFYHATGFYHDPFYRPVIAFIDPPRPRTDHTTYGPASRRENTLNNVSRRIVAADVADAALPGDRVPVQQAATRRTAGTGSSAGSAAPAARSPQPAAASGTQSTARTRREALNEAQAAAGSGTTQTYNRTQSGQTYNQSAARTDISRNADQAVPARQGSAGTYTAPSTERTAPVANPRREAVNSAQQQSRTAPQSSSTQPAVQQRNTQPAVQQPQQQSSGNATRRAARSTATQSSNNNSSTATRSATRSAASSAATRSSASSAATRSSAASSFGSSASTRSSSTYSAPSYSSTPSFSTSPSFGSSGGFSSGGGATRSGASSSGSSSRR